MPAPEFLTNSIIVSAIPIYALALAAPAVPLLMPDSVGTTNESDFLSAVRISIGLLAFSDICVITPSKV